jgi:hypothetical protein
LIDVVLPSGRVKQFARLNYIGRVGIPSIINPG